VASCASARRRNPRPAASRSGTRSRLNFREEIAVSGEDISSRARAEALLAWAEAPAVLNPAPVRIVALFNDHLAAHPARVGDLGLVGIYICFRRGQPLLLLSFRARVQKIIEAEVFAREFAILPPFSLASHAKNLG